MSGTIGWTSGWGIVVLPAWWPGDVPGITPANDNLLTDDFGQLVADDFGSHFINA